MSRDIGLYNAKFAVRRWIVHAPGVSRLAPNAVSIASLAPSALAAVALWYGWWPLVCLGILGRMLFTVADGLIAEEFDRRTRIGPYVNRLPQEIGDAILFTACLAWADPRWVILLLVAAWLVNIAGVLPALAGGSFQPVGPAGQPDRITIVLFAAAIRTFVAFDWTLVCVLIVLLSIPTFALRVRRTTRELRPHEG